MLHWEVPMPVIYYMDYMAYMLLTKCEVKMAGYWQSSFFAFLRTETQLRSMKMHKKYEADIQPSWPTKFGYKFFLLHRIKVGNRKGARWPHLAPLDSQSEHRIGFILPKGCFQQHINKYSFIFPFYSLACLFDFCTDTFFANSIVTIINCGILHFVLAETRLTC